MIPPLNDLGQNKLQIGLSMNKYINDNPQNDLVQIKN